MKKLFIIACCALFLAGCSKYDNTKASANIQVPPYTQIGANTFGTLINGAPWENFGVFIQHSELGFSSVDTNKVNASIYFMTPDTLYQVSAAQLWQCDKR